MTENLSARGAASVDHSTCWQRRSTTVRAECRQRTTGCARAGVVGEPLYARSGVGGPQYALEVVGEPQYATDVVGEPQYELSGLSVRLSPG